VASTSPAKAGKRTIQTRDDFFMEVSSFGD